MEAFINLRKSNRLVDTAAGYLILKEAGGKLFSFDGTEIDLELAIDKRFAKSKKEKGLVLYNKETNDNTAIMLVSALEMEQHLDSDHFKINFQVQF